MLQFPPDPHIKPKAPDAVTQETCVLSTEALNQSGSQIRILR